MTISRRALLVAVTAVGGPLALTAAPGPFSPTVAAAAAPVVAAAAAPAVAASAAPAVAVSAAPTVATAPGRVVIGLDAGQVADQDSSGGGGAPGVALPDGGAVALTGGPSGQQDVIELTAGGALDPSFGTGGVAKVPTGVGSIVRQSDGRFVLLGAGAAANDLPFPQLFAVRLESDGAL
ncbi:MAG TPA: hypothetical protein VHW26_07710, partial [Solirubrobacteraceae bacterium]|nr:hypothetical protein [Solirubrobacteraceae bacterium]